ncbi:MAG: DUF3822 family protein [Muribaculaceae bacterium]|nr:DUF3822 family protein [Muribaculaceae bacterium]
MNGTSPDTHPIERPRLWRLALQLEPGLLSAVIWSTVEDSTLRHFTLPLDPTLAGHKSLEEAVYAAPVLLSDFGRVDIAVRTPHYLTAPHGLGDDTAGKLLDYMCLLPEEPHHESRTDSIESIDTDIIWPVEADTAHFLARTFRYPRLMSHMTPLLRYFGSKSRQSNRGKLFAHFTECGGRRQADIIAMTANGTPSAVSTHTLSGEDDALYYILLAMQHAGLDRRTDEILLCGHAATRDAVMPRLRRYAANVMPVIFPSAAYRAGRDALQAPFPLIILPLCE